MDRQYPWSFAGNVAVATLLLAGVYLLGSEASHTVLVLPFYFLVVGFDVLEMVFGAVDDYRPLLVGVYLLTLGTVCAALLGIARDAVGGDSRGGVAAEEESSFRLAVAAPLLAVALLALGFAVAVGIGTGQRAPFWIAGGTGLLSLVLALAVAGIPQRALRPAGPDGDRGRSRR